VRYGENLGDRTGMGVRVILSYGREMTKSTLIFQYFCVLFEQGFCELYLGLKELD
jgi:hypothetical protein